MEPERPPLPEHVADGRPRWGLGDFFLGLLVGLVAAYVVGGVWLSVTHDEHVGFGLFVVTEAALWAGWLGAPLWASRLKGSGSLVADFGLRVHWRDAQLGVPVGLGAQLVLVPLIFLPLQRLMHRKSFEGPAQEVAKKIHGPEFVALALVFVLGAPLVEELFFRGLLLRSLTRRIGPVGAVLISAIAFAVLHLAPAQIPALFAVGVILAVLALRTGRLGPGVWCHGAFNAVAVLALALTR